MKITLYRQSLQKTYTEGMLYIDDKFFCYTIEDRVRAKAGLWRKLLKVYAQTAIPYGIYPVSVTWSNRFKRKLTAIFNVPDFEGIRIHNGSSALSSAGCVIVSYTRTGSGTISADKKAMNDICDIVAAAEQKEKVTILIVDGSK